MNKGLKAFAVLSLFGLGLVSVAGCGEDITPTLSISVDGTAVVNGGSVKVTEAKSFKLTATVTDAPETYTVTWGTNSASAFEFSATTGTEITATATKAGTNYQIFAQLEGDASTRSTINVAVDAATRSYTISVDTSEAKTSFFAGDQFTSDGLIVTQNEIVNGEVADSYTIANDQYTLSIAEGTVLTEEGTKTITVTPTDTSIAPVTYEISIGKSYIFDLASDMQNIIENGYTEYTVVQDGQQYYLMPYTIDDNQYYLNGDTSKLYHQADGQVDVYSLGVTQDQRAYALTYENIVWTNRKAETSLRTYVERIAPNDVTLRDWDEDLQLDLSNGANGVVVADGDAKAFFNNAFNETYYTLGSNNTVVANYYDVEIEPVQDFAGVYFAYFLDNTGEAVNGHIFGRLQEDATSMLSELNSIISKKPSGQYIDVSDGFVESNIDFAFNDLAGADYFVYTSAGFGDTYYITPDFVEAVYDQEVADILGHPFISTGYYNVKEQSKIEIGGEAITYNPGAAMFTVAYNEQNQVGYGFGAPENSVDFNTVNKGWSVGPGLVAEDFGYWSLDTIIESEFTDGVSNFPGFTLNYSYYDNTFDVVDTLEKIGFGAGSLSVKNDQGQTISLYERGFTGTPTKIGLDLSLIPMDGGNALGPVSLTFYGLVDGEEIAIESFSFVDSSYFATEATLDSYVAKMLADSPFVQLGLADLFVPVASAAQN